MSVEELRRALAGEYVVGEELGRGRSGVVLRARPARGGAEVALKATPLAPGTVAYARFEIETEVARGLRHEAVLPVLGAGVVGDWAYIVTPLAARGTAADLLRAEGAVPFDRVAAMLTSAAAALDHAHAHDVLHGALSPAKLLIDAEGRCRVSGFVLGGAASGTEELRGALGSPGYMSPEQRRGGRSLTGQSDQYALAIIAYEMISGVQRVGEATRGEPATFNPIDIMPNRPLRPGAPTAVNAVLRRALAKFPDQRYETCAAFVEALVAAWGRAPVEEPTGLVAWLRRRGVRAIAAAVVPPVLATGLVMFVTDPATWAAARSTTVRAHRTLLLELSLGRAGEAPGIGRAASGLSSVVDLPAGLVPAASSVRASTGSGTSSGGATGGGVRAAGTGPTGAAYRTPGGATASSGQSSGTNASGSLLDRYVRTPGSAASAGTGSAGSTGGAAKGADRDETAGAKDAEAGSGTLTVTVDSGRALVLVNGLPRGLTPYEGRVKPGAHTVSVRGFGRSYRPSSAPVTVRAGGGASASFAASDAP